MPRHEIVVERIPDEFQGKPVRLPDPAEMSHIYTRTVADYRTHNRKMLHECISCEVSFDMSSLEPVFDAWGPDAVISVSLSCRWVPGEPRPEPGAMPEFLRNRAKEIRGPGKTGTQEGPTNGTGPE